LRNVVLLTLKAPVPGTGWGCVVCDLPLDGAIALVCDSCIDAHANITQAVVGTPPTGDRVAISALTGTHDHDPRLHPAERTVP
jgi:hypothetical protein